MEQLLGMDFQTFCRSVLLAQNRFQRLPEGGTERDKVLKASSATNGSMPRRPPPIVRLDGGDDRSQSLDRGGARSTRRGDGSMRRGRARRRQPSRSRPSEAASDVRRLTESPVRRDRRRGRRPDPVAGTDRGVAPEGRGGRVLDAAGRAHGDVERATAAVEAAGRASSDAQLAAVRDQSGAAALVRAAGGTSRRTRPRGGGGGRPRRPPARPKRPRRSRRGGRPPTERRRRRRRVPTSARGRRRPRRAGSGRLGLSPACRRRRGLRGELVAGEPCPVCWPGSTVRNQGRTQGGGRRRKSAEKAEVAEAAIRAEREQLWWDRPRPQSPRRNDDAPRPRRRSRRSLPTSAAAEGEAAAARRTGSPSISARASR